MVTINVSDKTKKRFLRMKLDLSAKANDSISEDGLINLLLNKFENGAKK